MRKAFWAAMGALAVGLAPQSAAAAAAGGASVSPGDTAWVLVSAALVMLMTPGLAFFYSGLVRKRNVITTLMQCFITIAIVSVQWVLFGYSLAFGPDVHGLIGNLSWAGFSHVGVAPDANYATTIPHLAFAGFQLMFAVITPALIVGGLAERVKFSAFVAFIALWVTLVYDPLAHWVWGVGGWLGRLGVLDFAGGTVVHISSGVAGLVAALYLGHRKGYGSEPMVRHNVPFVMLGASLLWFGWFGFNAGSALGANGLAALAFMTTNTATAAAVLGWLAVEWIRTKRTTLTGASTGAVAGLVAITPAAGFVPVGASLVIGLFAGMICYGAIAIFKERAGYDDALDAFGGHGIGGTWGALATGLFASAAINGHDGLFYGNPHQLLLQSAGVAVSWVFVGLMTWGLLKVVDLVFGLRVDPAAEEEGLDIHLHGETAYPEDVEPNHLHRLINGFARDLAEPPTPHGRPAEVGR